MSASGKLPVIAAIAGAGASLAAMASSSTLRAFLSRLLGISAPGGTWRLIALILAAINLKNLPFMWHVSITTSIPTTKPPYSPSTLQIRLFRGLVYQLYLQPTPLPPRALFQPIVTSTRTPLTECDYNLHKSNSTYFSDLDISRTHLVTALLRQGIRSINKPPKDGSEPDTRPGNFAIALGGITCHFRREVAPYARFEIWTRLLCWDRKWLYLVSHLVRPGVAEPPASYTLQPWRRRRGGGGGGGGGGRGKKDEDEDEEARRKKLNAAVYATSIAKYVVKKGRWTVPAEQALLNSGLLPGPRPQELGSLESNADSPPPPPPVAAAATSGAVDGSYVLPTLAPRAGDDDDAADDQCELTWPEIEAERQRGMKLAELFAGLDEAHFEFTGGKDGVLGEYSDMLTPFW
ncbi:capsule polysaccharide biosynthesis protein [Diplodia corticola]|uniref:Capsule polysaccharide biosynthesis protein n=1 Tax=Diplodia corticola TaxID=236234 RepID=A0A1J9RVH0_9PEZI|nr:capsule polysaccharide biosynthesis protein [Diplodia corticola]OJD31493.1 capsule polysaccharide biosynthesis protein [Diplodia corticola]